VIIPARIPRLLTCLYPTRVWKIPTAEKELFITFDDGPDPRITSRVLDVLAAHGAKASFFCVGDRVARFPELYGRILDEGHAVGNHTHHHLNGWKTSNHDYWADVDKASHFIDSCLFRPPYGRIRSKQAEQLSKRGFKTIMWTVLSGDYDASLSKEACARRVLGPFEQGSIYLFHDAEKAEKNMFHALEKLLETAGSAGFRFEKINPNAW